MVSEGFCQNKQERDQSSSTKRKYKTDIQYIKLFERQSPESKVFGFGLLTYLRLQNLETELIYH